jgi:hypothetical protein
MDEHIDMVRKALERDLLAIEIVVFVVGSLDTLLDVTHAEFSNVGRYCVCDHLPFGSCVDCTALRWSAAEARRRGVAI